MIGKRVGPWLIVEEIGDGGHAFVFKGVRADESVAVKMLKPSAAAEDHLEKRFKIEAEALKTLEHPSIVGFRDYVYDNGYHYLVLEYMDAGAVDHLMRTMGPIDARYAVPIFNQILKGVAHAHAFGYIHRDIKPNNILLNRKGEAKLTDFGIARVLGGEALTKKGFVLGTSAYMAPEYLTHGRATEQLDVYALGVTFYEMLTCRKPFEFERDDEPLKSFAERVLKGTPQPPSAYVPTPPALERVLMTAIAREEKKRYRSAEKFRDELCAACPDLVDRPILIRQGRAQTDLIQLQKLTPAPVPRTKERGLGGFFKRLIGKTPSTPEAAPSVPAPAAAEVDPHAGDAVPYFSESGELREAQMTELSELGAYLAATSGADKGKRFGLRPVSRIGRDLRFDIRPRDPEISRQHAVVTFDGAGFRLKDLGSANGTFVNERKLADEYELQHGDIVRVGRTSLRFEFQRAG
ncbi:MAG TPA: FHA domain-containing serine/threonine-protein kinase [Planctomycetota bacterium]|nr:FHA domain-containing serine/threonine-protein kinase [Planctomycetota bacterium]